MNPYVVVPMRMLALTEPENQLLKNFLVMLGHRTRSRNMKVNLSTLNSEQGIGKKTLFEL